MLRKSETLIFVSDKEKVETIVPCVLKDNPNKHGYSTPDFKNIVMPFDASPESREKVGMAVQVAKYYNADIRIVSVFHPSDEKAENELLPYLHQVKKFIKDKGVNCTNKSIPSTMIAETIIEYANKNDCDLIIQMNKKDKKPL